MAKANPVPPDGIKLEQVTGLPDVQRRGFGDQAGPYQDAMRMLKPPKGNQYSTFFIPATFPVELTDPAEQEKAKRDNCRKMSNSFNGIARRIMKSDENYKFAFRTTLQDPSDETSPLGVRVYRVAA